jgi:hypothetical protein
MGKEVTKMNQQPPKTSSGDTAKIVGIVCATSLVIALLVYFGFTDWVASQTPPQDGKPYASPVINQLPLLLAFITTTIAAFIGNAVITGKVAKKINKIEKQTNGRTHVRDAQLDVAMLALKGAFANREDVQEAVKRVLNMPRDHEYAPEDEYTEEQTHLQSEILRLTTQLNELKKQGDQGGNE